MARRTAIRVDPVQADQVGHTGTEIDRGLTGDKIGAFDPAAAPMQTDSEAAGAATDPATSRRASQAQIDAVSSGTRQTRYGALPQPGDRRGRSRGWLLLVAIIVLVAAGAALAGSLPG